MVGLLVEKLVAPKCKKKSLHASKAAVAVLASIPSSFLVNLPDVPLGCFVWRRRRRRRRRRKRRGEGGRDSC